MVEVTFRFVEPNSWVGRLITWRLKEPWSHVVILVDDVVYSSQIPFVSMLPTDHKTVAMPPRNGLDVVISVSEEEAASIRQWCESQVGTWYDLASILGWILGANWLQSSKRSYCFEYCRKAAVHVGWLEPARELIKGNRLIAELRQVVRLRGVTEY